MFSVGKYWSRLIDCNAKGKSLPKQIVTTCFLQKMHIRVCQMRGKKRLNCEISQHNSQGKRKKKKSALFSTRKTSKYRVHPSAPFISQLGNSRKPFLQCLCSSLTHYFNTSREGNYAQPFHCRHLTGSPTVLRISYSIRH